MGDNEDSTPEPASSRPDVEVVFKEVMATQDGKPRDKG